MKTEKQIDFKKHPVLRAYTLLVCWRFKKIDEELFGSKEYHRRRVEQIQESENTRRRLHKDAIKILEELGFKNKETCKILENECERLIKEKFRELKEDECFCGACRVILKRSEWEKHGKENKDLHDCLNEELFNLSKEQTLMRMSIMEDKRREK